MGYSKSSPIFVWMKPDPGEPELKEWMITEVACTEKKEVDWWDSKYDDNLCELQEELSEDPPPDDCSSVLITCHLFSEVRHTYDGTEYDGGVEIDELVPLYENNPSEKEKQQR